MTDKGTPDKAAPKPSEWLQKREEGMKEPEKKLWDSAYSKVHAQNHYHSKEGPTQALERLKKQGLLADLAFDDIPKEATKKVKAELGKHGELHRNHYTYKDQVLSGDQEQKEVGAQVEKEKKHQQAERLAPTTDQIKAAMTPEIADKLKKAGLNVDPAKLGEQI